MIQIKEGFTGERSVVLPEMVRRACQESGYLSQLYITDIGYYPHAMHHYRERPEGTPQHVLIYCIKGSGWYRVRGQHHEVSSGQYFVLPPGEPHVYASNNYDPWTIYWIHFAGFQAEGLMPATSGPQKISSTSNSRITDRNTIFEEIFLTLSDSYGLDNLCYASSLLYGFLATFRYVRLFRKYNSLESHIATNDIAAAAVRYMKENIEMPLNLAQIAAYTGYSVTRFSAMFKNKTGHSVVNYLNILKIQRSCQLLETTNMKINQICAKVGIDDSYYFSRLFRKIIGVPPKEYRQKVSAKEEVRDKDSSFT